MNNNTLSSDEALHIARQDAEKAYGDLSVYRTTVALESDGWHIDYEVRSPLVAGGGPHYVIDAQTGTIRIKRYDQERERGLDVKTVWKRIHTWLDANAPLDYGSLRPGASAKEIQAAEKAMGLRLPDDFKASYHIHDGQGMEPGLVGGEGWRLLSLKEIVETWGRWSRSNPMDTQRVRIAWIGTGDYVFLNLDPDSGEPGCLMIQRADSIEPDPLVPSFSTWLENFADELEDGVFAFSEDDVEVVLADDLPPD